MTIFELWWTFLIHNSFPRNYCTATQSGDFQWIFAISQSQAPTNDKSSLFSVHGGITNNFVSYFFKSSITNRRKWPIAFLKHLSKRGLGVLTTRRTLWCKINIFSWCSPFDPIKLYCAYYYVFGLIYSKDEMLAHLENCREVWLKAMAAEGRPMENGFCKTWEHYVPKLELKIHDIICKKKKLFSYSDQSGI